MNYYKLLNVSVKADDKELKKAYRNLAKKYHPDMYQGDKKIAEDKMQEINEAYETLSDANRRKEYDISIGLSKKPEEEHMYTKYNSNSNSTSNYTSRQNVRYRPNHTNTYYDSNGYAETNYSTYTGERYRRNRYEEEIKFDVKNVAVKIIGIVLIAIIAITFSLNMVLESISELNNNKLINNKSENTQNDNSKYNEKSYYTPRQPKENKEESRDTSKSDDTTERKNGVTSEELNEKLEKLDIDKEEVKKELEKLDIDEEKLKQALIQLKDALEKYNAENSN